MTPMPAQRRPLSAEEIAAYRRDGVVCLRGIFDLDSLRPLAGAVEEAMAAPSPLHKSYQSDTPPGLFFGDYNMWKRLVAFRRFAHESPAPGIAASLMGADRINLYNEHLLVKEPGADAPTPWHQDVPYYQLTSIWIGLDPVEEKTGAMRFVRGSHRWGKIFRRKHFASNQDLGQADSHDALPDIDSHEAEYDIVCHHMEPGDCTVHDALTLHASGPNLSPTMRRRGLSLRYAGDDVRWQPRTFNTGETSASAGLDRDVDLAPGAILDSAQFPLVYRR
jgi:ectoine hydroxylase-related dioxygenase (phytanoyl-CoA dioxygenase family)